MTVRTIYSDPHDDLRAALRALCAEFSDDYHRNNGRNRTYPVKSIDALTKGGWLSAMIPEKFGGSGLGLTKASIVMEGTNRCGCNAVTAMVRCITWGPCSVMGPPNKNFATFLPLPLARCVCNQWRDGTHNRNRYNQDKHCRNTSWYALHY